VNANRIQSLESRASLKIDVVVRLLDLWVMTPMTNQPQLPVTIYFRVRGIDFTDELRKAVERIVVFALDRYHPQMDKISVYMADLNGPKGGVDKLCQITAKLSRGNPVLILEQGSEILTTVNRAAHRLGHRIGRAVQRQNRPDSRRFRQSIRTA
jgi:putative sigma-54 modulation protein